MLMSTVLSIGHMGAMPFGTNEALWMSAMFGLSLNAGIGPDAPPEALVSVAFFEKNWFIAICMKRKIATLCRIDWNIDYAADQDFRML